MAEQTIALTLAQVTDIFDAGRQRGIDEATAFEWGSHCFGTRDGELADAICETFNEGVAWDDPRYLKGGTLEAVWAAAQGMQLREDSRSEAEAEGLQPGPAKQDAP